jgi:predicted secreted protein
MRVLALLTALLLAPPLAAQTPSSRDADGFTTLVLSESAQRDMRRDRVRVTLRAEEVGGDPAAVQAAINRRMTAALDRARAVPGLRVETGGYWVGEERRENAPVRWRGNQTMTLVASDPAPALALAGELQQAGMLAAGVGWELTPEALRKVEDELVGEALARLRARAEMVAREMNLVVVRTGRMWVGDAATDRPMPMARGAPMAMAAAVPPIAAEAGEQTVRVAVRAEILLRAK